MLGIFLNLLLVACGSLAIATAISFFIHEPESGYIRVYTLHFGSAIFMICTGYVFMAFTENLNYAYIPRFLPRAGWKRSRPEKTPANRCRNRQKRIGKSASRILQNRRTAQRAKNKSLKRDRRGYSAAVFFRSPLG